MAFLAVVSTLLCLNFVAGHYHHIAPPPAPCCDSNVAVTYYSSKSGSGCGGGAGSGFGGGAGGAGGGAGAMGFSPIIIEQVAPAPIAVGLPLTPNVIDHQSAPYEINYFGTPYVVKAKQNAALTVFSQTPVVVDTYAEPLVHESAAPAAVIVEEVCPSPSGGGGQGSGSGSGSGAYYPAPCGKPCH